MTDPDWRRIAILAGCAPKFPVQAHFNAISDRNFLSVLSHNVRRTGASIEYCTCCFPSDLNPGDAPFEGLRFSLFDDEVVITEAEFLQFARLACDAFRRGNG